MKHSATFLPIIITLFIIGCNGKTEIKVADAKMIEIHDSINQPPPPPPPIPNIDSFKRKLSGKTITIDVLYAAIDCECAQWLVTSKINGEPDDSLYIYLEPANNKLVNGETLWDGKHLPLELKLTGQFYLQKGFPANYKTKGTPEPAKVFRYSKIIIHRR